MQHCYNGGTNCLAEVKAFFYPQLTVTYSVFVHKVGWLYGLVGGIPHLYSILAGFTRFRAKFQYRPGDCNIQVCRQNTGHKAQIPQNV
jgi:hypothetical protein